MIAGVEPAVVIRAVGAGATCGRQLAAALRALRFRVPSTRLRRFHRADQLPAIAIVRAISDDAPVDRRSRQRLGHWVAWAEGRVWDPQSRWVRSLVELAPLRATSYLEIVPA